MTNNTNDPAAGTILYAVNEWGSHPDLENDDCWTGRDYATLEEAQAAMDALTLADIDRSTSLVVLTRVEVGYTSSTVRGRAQRLDRDLGHLATRRFRADQDYAADDASWRQEIAMEAGMLGGVEAYNEVMGY